MAREVGFVRLSGLLLLLLLMAATSQGHRTFERCELARELNSLDVPRNELAIWVCIAKHESSYRTWVKGPPNTDDSIDHGIFQINDRYWCRPSDGRESKNGCNVNCDALRTDHINTAVRCAQLVKRSQGWGAWSVYPRHCAGQLPSIDDCFGGSSYLAGVGMHGKF